MTILIPRNELNEFSLPRVCVGTGQAGPVTFQKVQFQYVPKWIAAFAIAPLLYIIFFLVLRKTASGTLPFSDEGWARVKAGRRNVAIATVGLLVAIFGGVFVTAQLDQPAPLLVLLLAGIVAIVVASMQLRKVYPYATLIDDRMVTLKLPSAEAEALFSRHLSAGARTP
ncbi:MAG: hypothetical protein ACOZQL_00015 [Myxococcota bacterium]